MQVADGVLQDHLQGGGFSDAEILGRGRTQAEEQRDGVHALLREAHLLFVEGILAAAPAGVDGRVGPDVGVIALEGVVALADVALEAHGAQRGGVDPHRVDVFEVEEPAVGGQRAADAFDLVAGLAVGVLFGGLDLHGADLRVGEHLGLVAHAVEELFARMVELRGEGRGCGEQEYEGQETFHRWNFTR